jgi:hypothetical protein
MIKNKKTQFSNAKKYNELIFDISDILTQGRKLAHQAVNTILTTTYWQIGRQIVEFEQGGKERAEYGEAIIKQLSVDLTKRFGKGFSYRNLQQIKKFYATFGIVQTVSAQSFSLSWSHYVRLMSIENLDERSFYEIECEKNNWSVRELCRQFNTSLFERLALSRDKKGIKALAEKGQIIEKRRN